MREIPHGEHRSCQACVSLRCGGSAVRVKLSQQHVEPCRLRRVLDFPAVHLGRLAVLDLHGVDVGACRHMQGGLQLANPVGARRHRVGLRPPLRIARNGACQVAAGLIAEDAELRSLQGIQGVSLGYARLGGGLRQLKRPLGRIGERRHALGGVAGGDLEGREHCGDFGRPFGYTAAGRRGVYERAVRVEPDDLVLRPRPEGLAASVQRRGAAGRVRVRKQDMRERGVASLGHFPAIVPGGRP